MAQSWQYRKVAWSEGMFLEPEHFQQWERYHERLLHLCFKPIKPFWYGIIELQIDDSNIADGNFSLEHCYAIFPDGSIVDIPYSDDPPELKSIDFSALTRSSSPIKVYLAIRESKDTETVPISADSDRTIDLVKKETQILLDDEPADGYQRIQIAELIRAPQNQEISIRKDYIPPLFLVSASYYLKILLDRLIQTLVGKRKELSAIYLPEQGEVYSLSNVEPLVPWTIQALSRSIPVLKHFQNIGYRITPEELFRELSRLAGDLSSFIVNADAEKLFEANTDAKNTDAKKFAYNHEELSPSFSEMDKLIRSLLSLVKPERREKVIELKKQQVDRGVTIFHGDLEGKAIQGRQLYLGVRIISTDERNQVTKLTRRVTTPDTVQRYIRPPKMANITVQSQLPAGVRMLEGYEYFLVANDSVDWEEILNTKVLAIGFPKTQHNEAELVAIRIN